MTTIIDNYKKWSYVFYGCMHLNLKRVKFEDVASLVKQSLTFLGSHDDGVQDHGVP